MTRYDPRRHHRRSIRLKGYDYRRPGAYFVTCCTYDHEALFGEVEDGEMVLNELGVIVQQVWDDLVNHYGHVYLDAFVAMPNHVHGIIVLMDEPGVVGVGAGLKPAPTPKRHGLPEIVRGFKTFSARRINERRGTPGVPVWQRNYYEHIVRDEHALRRIQNYILHNPANWELDIENLRGGKRAVDTYYRSIWGNSP